ncbi:hypothetical protein GDO86_006767 [Hymenochirus boettgeri]|uniref:inositol-polyphosphate 5-phosphatase n=1 Tax=Hymenochirus boettgeri TaxID=247094 RepID=A0A8T2JC42_9PIPI|nr:hypothetical protein GDO86_006767 [Hymenochirus boettgeri]
MCFASLSEEQFVPLSGRNLCLGSLDDCPLVHKERFPQDFWTEFPWTRKGFMRTRWQIHNRTFDLVNLHLFHDSSNLVSCDSSPSLYSINRKKALNHILTRLQDDGTVPFFLFGDFNFRLDLKSLTLAQGWTTRKTTERDNDSILYERDGEVKLLVQCKLFEQKNVEIFQENNLQALRKFDSEPSAYLSKVTESQISFPPSYPYIESITGPSEFMCTRCPAWCDRVLMSHSARALLGKAEIKVRYDQIGAHVCMGDHKPVFLHFEMDLLTSNHTD